MYQQLIKPLLFQLNPEQAHQFTTTQLKLICKWGITRKILDSLWGLDDQRLEINRMGLRFKNPVGLAAGFDKDASYIPAMSQLGFGFLEVGTVTPKPQQGNPKPRLFRLPADQALINRMGFNNQGVDHMVRQLKAHQDRSIIIGGNLGKNKLTPNEDAINDYAICFEALFPLVDYFVVNVSSPNTPGLRSLQEKEPLDRLLGKLQAINKAKPTRKPILLKIAPDLTYSQLDDVLEVVSNNVLDGRACRSAHQRPRPSSSARETSSSR